MKLLEEAFHKVVWTMKYLIVIFVVINVFIGQSFATIYLPDVIMLAESTQTNKSPAQSEALSHDFVKSLQPGDYDFAFNTYYFRGYYKTAFNAALKRAEKGDATAQTLLATLYSEGRGVERDIVKAVYWYGKAAQLGDPEAQLLYGINLYNGLYVDKDLKQGEAYIKKAMEAGIARAYYYYGNILMDNAPRDERPDVGLPWFLQGAARGDDVSAYRASQILAEGTEKIAKDDILAYRLLQIASNRGNISAQIDMIHWKLDGRGGPKDSNGAFHLMRGLALNGVPQAQIALARLYRGGIGTKPDSVMAAAWYILAKQQDIVVDDLEAFLKDLSPAKLKQAQQQVGQLLKML